MFKFILYLLFPICAKGICEIGFDLSGSSYYTYDNYYKMVTELKEKLSKDENLIDPNIKFDKKKPWKFLLDALLRRVKDFTGKVKQPNFILRFDLDTYYKLLKLEYTINKWEANHPEDSLVNSEKKKDLEQFLNWLGQNM